MQGLLLQGRVYKIGAYANAKSDTSPLLFVFQNDYRKYVEGVNVNYLSDTEMRKLAEIIVRIYVNFREVGISGLLLYGVLLSEAPNIIKRAYRKYFLAYLTGVYLVSNGVTNPDAGSFKENAVNYRHPFVIYLNRLLKPDITNKVAEKQKKLTNKIIATF